MTFPIFTREHVLSADAGRYFAHNIGSDYYTEHDVSHPTKRTGRLIVGALWPRLIDNITYFTVRRSFKERRPFKALRRYRVKGHSEVKTGRVRVDYYYATASRDYCVCSVGWDSGDIVELDSFATQHEATESARQLAQR